MSGWGWLSMNEYKLLVAYEVFQFLEALPKRERQLLRDRFVSITAWPAQFSDFKEPDSTGRNLDVNLCGKLAIRYWDGLRRPASEDIGRYFCGSLRRAAKSPMRA